MQWDLLLSPQRLGGRVAAEDVRSEYQKDIDRILFSDPFRRLARKTQVHPLNENDHIHSRLTHSLETSSVGRSLGEMVGRFLGDELKVLPQGMHPFHVGQIVQAACLAHDIGNPPFGHSGETAIKNWFVQNPELLDRVDPDCRHDFLTFDGNAMSVRTLASTGFSGKGMDPTLAVLGALMKYPWPSSQAGEKEKFSIFQAEWEDVAKAARAMGMLERGGCFVRHPLAYLTEAADDICYRVIDIEDATEVGLLEPSYMYEALGEVARVKGNERYGWCEDAHFRSRNGLLRAMLINAATKEVVETFKENYQAIMDGGFDQSVSLMRSKEDGVCAAIYMTYKNISPKIFLSRRKVVLEMGAQRSLGMLLDAIVDQCLELCSGAGTYADQQTKTLLGRELANRITPGRSHCPYQAIMTALDYVTGMSDQYATAMCRKLLGLGY